MNIFPACSGGVPVTTRTSMKDGFLSANLSVSYYLNILLSVSLEAMFSADFDKSPILTSQQHI